MNLFDLPQAQHFCALPAAPLTGQVQSLSAFHDRLSKTVKHLHEGTTNFDVHRASLLHAVERWLLFGVTQYRRALDMFLPSAAPWAQVTLYYASFYAANSILGMFGGWLGLRRLVEVERGTAGSQLLRILRDNKVKSPTGVGGSHQVFWDFFYQGCTHISPWAPQPLLWATQPINNKRTWQIEARNQVNYDTYHAYDSAIQFKASFNPQKLRASLTGDLRQQLELTEALLKLAAYFAIEVKLPDLALTGFNVAGRRSKVIRSLVTSKPPNLVDQCFLGDMLP